MNKWRNNERIELEGNKAIVSDEHGIEYAVDVDILEAELAKEIERLDGYTVAEIVDEAIDHWVWIAKEFGVEY